MEARPTPGLRVNAIQDLTGTVTLTEQIWSPITPRSPQLRTTVDAYRRIFRQFAAHAQDPGQRYRAEAWHALLDYFCHACQEGVRSSVQADFIAAATALVHALEEPR
jgi:hypothetical protein